MSAPIGFAANVSPAPWEPPYKFSMGYPRYADELTEVNPTRPGPYWFYALSMEIINVIQAAGLTFNPADNTQFLTALRTILGAPSVDFSASPRFGVLPVSVAFTDLTMPPATAWAWDFGDGGTSTAQNPTHIYSTAGTYTVALTATVFGSPVTTTKTAYVTVTIADLGWNSADMAAGLSLSNSSHTVQQNTGNLGTGWIGVRAVTSRSAGLLYFELVGLETSNDEYIGIADASYVLASGNQPIFGGAAGHWAFIRESNGQVGNDTVGYAGFAGTPPTGTNVWGFAVNFTTRTVSIFLNGTYVFATTWGAGAAAMFPCVVYLQSLLTAPDSTDSKMTLRTAASEFTYAIPTGYSAWGA